jgi:hypothetical protein
LLGLAGKVCAERGVVQVKSNSTTHIYTQRLGVVFFG